MAMSAEKFLARRSVFSDSLDEICWLTEHPQPDMALMEADY